MCACLCDVPRSRSQEVRLNDIAAVELMEIIGRGGQVRACCRRVSGVLQACAYSDLCMLGAGALQPFWCCTGTLAAAPHEALRRLRRNQCRVFAPSVSTCTSWRVSTAFAAHVRIPTHAYSGAVWAGFILLFINTYTHVHTQGVVFRGTVHGIEAAIKVISHRDEADEAAAAKAAAKAAAAAASAASSIEGFPAAGGTDSPAAAAAAAAAGQLGGLTAGQLAVDSPLMDEARMRERKRTLLRDALELAVTSTIRCVC